MISSRSWSRSKSQTRRIARFANIDPHPRSSTPALDAHASAFETCTSLAPCARHWARMGAHPSGTRQRVSPRAAAIPMVGVRLGAYPRVEHAQRRTSPSDSPVKHASCAPGSRVIHNACRMMGEGNGPDSHVDVDRCAHPSSHDPWAIRRDSLAIHS
jgi:hypothetical protein